MKLRTKKILIAVAFVSMIALAGCAGADSGADETGDLEDSTGEDSNTDDVGQSYWYEIGVTENNQQRLVEANPPFVMESSLERENLIRRYKHVNDAENKHHVYMMSYDGKVVKYQVAQGKVSSVNSKLTNDVQIVKAQDCDWHDGSEGACYKTVESPQMDGSYGTNGDAIFFFTPQGEYVEWNGIYYVSEEPQNIQTEVTLTRNVDG